MLPICDYYPFGMQMPGRNSNSSNYRYGYNGMEKDDEVKGISNSYTTEFRQYDPRLGRWLSLDPIMGEFPDMSPYVAFDDNPVFYIDPLGLKSEGGPGELDEVEVTAKRTFGMKFRSFIREVKSINKNSDLTWIQKNGERNRAWGKFLHSIGKHNLANATAVSGGTAMAIQNIVDVQSWGRGISGMFDFNKKERELQQRVRETAQIADKTGYSAIRSAVLQDMVTSANNWKNSDLQSKSTVVSGKVIEVASIAWGGILLSRGSAAMRAASTPTTIEEVGANNISKLINAGKQGKHIVGHNNYQVGKSILTENPQGLLNDFHLGKVNSYQIINDVKTRVNFGKVIGTVEVNGVSTPTTNGIIHNSKSGAHIVPSNP